MGNFKRGPAKFHKIRKIATVRSRGVILPVYGITIPTDLAKNFEGVYFSARVYDSKIVLESGCK